MELVIVVGGQAGSEGKGAVVGHLLKKGGYDLVARVGGPNAGHTVIDEGGRRWAFRQLPVGAVIDRNLDLVIAQGSEIDLEVLEKEIDEANGAGWDVSRRLYIDGQCTVIDEHSKMMEMKIGTGTTGKGIGGARAKRALRDAKLMKQYGVEKGKWRQLDTTAFFNGETHEHKVMIEGTQGFILGTHAGEYPFVTSGNCRAIDFMAACGCGPQAAEVWVVLRMNPIRIAGNSGDLKKEIGWDDLGVPEERTTVTNKVRRVGEWDMEWAYRSVMGNKGTRQVKVALTMVDYKWPGLKEVRGKLGMIELPDGLRNHISRLEDACDNACRVEFLGTGPATGIDLQRSYDD